MIRRSAILLLLALALGPGASSSPGAPSPALSRDETAVTTPAETKPPEATTGATAGDETEPGATADDETEPGAFFDDEVEPGASADDETTSDTMVDDEAEADETKPGKAETDKEKRGKAKRLAAARPRATLSLLEQQSQATRSLLGEVHRLAARVEEGDLGRSDALRKAVNGLRSRLRAGKTGAVATIRAQVALYHGYRALGGPGDEAGRRAALGAMEPDENPFVKHVVPEIAVVERTRTPKRLCAITFDDGPHRKATPEILDILERYDAKATFFLLGMQVAANPKLAKAVVDAGHAVGHHSYHHKQYTRLGDAAIRREWKLCDKVMARALGKPLHVTMFRLPYNRGHSSTRIHKVLAERYDRIVGWSIDSADYKERSARRMANRVLSHPLKKGSIILFHDHGAATLEALEIILRSMVEQGFRFVTVPELIGADEGDGARRVFVRALRNLDEGQAKRAFYDLIWVGREFPESLVADAALFFASNVARAYLGKTDFADKLQDLLRKRHANSIFLPLLEKETTKVASSDGEGALGHHGSARSE